VSCDTSVSAQVLSGQYRKEVISVGSISPPASRHGHEIIPLPLLFRAVLCHPVRQNVPISSRCDHWNRKKRQRSEAKVPPAASRIPFRTSLPAASLPTVPSRYIVSFFVRLLWCGYILQQNRYMAICLYVRTDCTYLPASV